MHCHAVRPPPETARLPPNSVVAGAATSGTGIARQTVTAGTTIVLAMAATLAQTPDATER